MCICDVEPNEFSLLTVICVQPCSVRPGDSKDDSTSDGNSRESDGDDDGASDHAACGHVAARKLM